MGKEWIHDDSDIAQDSRSGDSMHRSLIRSNRALPDTYLQGPAEVIAAVRGLLANATPIQNDTEVEQARPPQWTDATGAEMLCYLMDIHGVQRPDEYRKLQARYNIPWQLHRTKREEETAPAGTDHMSEGGLQEHGCSGRRG